MATDEEFDEAEQLRLLALHSMVKRSKPKSKPKNFKIKNDETDDSDIVLLRAAALKTITHKSNTQNRLLVNENSDPFQGKDVSGKRSCEASPLRSKKHVIIQQNMSNEQLCNFTNDPSIESYKKSLEHIKKEQCGQDKPEIKSKLVANNNDNTKKIVRNGSIQLSNLDSEKVNETLVLHITFSSSESDDSSSECDTDNVC